jgi:hypothetical protein
MRTKRARTATIDAGSLRWRSGLLGALLLLTSLSATTLPDDKLKPTDPYALIFGTVYGPDARPVVGVKVRIRRAHEKKARWELYSDRRGEFAQRVRAGKAEYVVWAEVKTKDKQTPKPQVLVSIENDERVDISLHLRE